MGWKAWHATTPGLWDIFRRAAEGGDPLGAYKLGCYYAGQGDGIIPADADEALRYKLIAAEAGYVLAQVEVAQIYASRGDHARAVLWYEAAGRQGDWQALFMAVIPVGPQSAHADRPRAWLYVAAIGQMLAQMAPADMPREESEEMQRSMADMRRMTEEGMSESDRAEGERLLAAWQFTRSPLSLSADQGLNAARRLVGLPPVT